MHFFQILDLENFQHFENFKITLKSRTAKNSVREKKRLTKVQKTHNQQKFYNFT